ncbi:MAG: nucleotidyltransferase family protein [Pseudomonadota bacterium]
MHNAIGFPLTAGRHTSSGESRRARDLEDILRADPVLWPALQTARELNLPDWWVVSGAVYNTVWNAVTGRPPGYGIKDIDLFYFDPDTRWEAEDRIIRSGKRHFTGSIPVEIRNQARVHLWYEDHFGRPIAAHTDCRESIANFACETHAIGVRLTTDDRFEIYAPYGLDAVFDLRLVPNPVNRNRRTHEAKAERASALWPEISVDPWPEVTVVRCGQVEDWRALHALLVRAFAYMENRIDPPSSLNRMTPDEIARKAGEELCFIAHDGIDLIGCIFCKIDQSFLYVGKLAVNPAHQGKGIGKALMTAAETEARRLGLRALELQTRVELTENHRTFTRMGFTKSGETSHPGFDRATSITMRKPV